MPSHYQLTKSKKYWYAIQQLYKHVNLLDPRELEIITLRYGLFNEHFNTQKEIAEWLNISRSYVSLIEKRALIKLYQQFTKNKRLIKSEKLLWLFGMHILHI